MTRESGSFFYGDTFPKRAILIIPKKYLVLRNNVLMETFGQSGPIEYVDEDGDVAVGECVSEACELGAVAWGQIFCSEHEVKIATVMSSPVHAATICPNLD